MDVTTLLLYVGILGNKCRHSRQQIKVMVSGTASVGQVLVSGRVFIRLLKYPRWVTVSV